MKYIFSVLSIIIGVSSFAQNVEWQALTREISIDHGDSIIKARIMINPDEIKIENEYFYFWHSKGQINKNMGGYSGDILHGVYIVFNNKKHMITQGQFDIGLKNGIWKRWYENGNLRTLENWKKGFLHGSFKIYEENGDLEKNIEYNKGQAVIKEDKSFRIFTSDRFKAVADSTVSDTIVQH